MIPTFLPTGARGVVLPILMCVRGPTILASAETFFVCFFITFAFFFTTFLAVFFTVFLAGIVTPIGRFRRACIKTKRTEKEYNSVILLLVINPLGHSSPYASPAQRDQQIFRSPGVDGSCVFSRQQTTHIYSILLLRR